MLKILIFLFAASSGHCIQLRNLPSNLVYKKSATGFEPTPRVIKGENAEEGQFPYMVSLSYNYDQHLCGASILTNKWILTAAKCCIPSYNQTVFAGTVFINGTGQRYDIDLYKIHGSFDFYNDYRNDICVIRIKGEFEFNDRIQPVTLTTQDWPINEGDVSAVMGWGYVTPEWENEGVMPDRLQVAYNFSILSNENCGRQSGIEMFDGYLCVEASQKGQGACRYDYGGPLIKDNVQIGVMSWAELPCATGYPDFYTRLTYYIDWIKQALGPDEQHLQFVNLASADVTVSYASSTPENQDLIKENYRYDISPKITQGEDAHEGQFPFIVSFETKEFGHACSGAILTKKWILTTAACCLFKYRLNAFAGTIFLNGTGQKYYMSEYVIPGDYDPSKQYRNNICLARLEGEFQFSDRVQQVTLPSQDWTINEGDLTTVIGWGLRDTSIYEMSNTLQVGYNFTALSNEHCGELLTGVDIYDGFICAQGQRGQGICTGDGGDPLMKGDVLIGIASLYISPCGSGIPEIYTRVPRFVDWIKKEMGEDSRYLKLAN